MTLSRLTRTALPLVLTVLNLSVAAQQADMTPASVLEDKIKENVVAAASDESSSSQVSLEKKASVESRSSAEENGSATERAETQEEKAHELTEADQTHDENVKSTLVQISEEEQKKINDLIRQAEVYLYGDGVPVNLQKAAELYNAAGDLGSPKAKLRLSTMYRQGQGVQKDLNHAFELVMEAANQDFAPAQSALSSYFRTGIGVNKDIEQANYWLEKAAENGHTRSKVLFSTILERDVSNPASLEKAKRFIEEVKSEASPQEIYSIGYSYANGFGLPKDLKKAMEWARLGADKGEVNSIYLLGDCYWREKNIAEASVWFEKAAEKGLRAAQLQTGRLYRDGAPGVEKNLGKAVKWLEIAYPSGDKNDVFSLVVMRTTGPKAVRNLAKGQEWLDRYIPEATVEELNEQGEKFWNGDGVRRNFNLGGALCLAALKKGDRTNLCGFAEKLGTKNWRKADFVTSYSLLNQCVIDHPEN
ncbi:tetratricopeptide repeat protein [Turicimonas muris]|nr:tetratricopeptide repeat protein [Turicimonas muris]